MVLLWIFVGILAVFLILCIMMSIGNKRLMNDFKKNLKNGDVYVIYLDNEHAFSNWRYIEFSSVELDTVVYRVFYPSLDKRNEYELPNYCLNGSEFEKLKLREGHYGNYHECSFEKFWNNVMNKYKYKKISI